MALGMGIDELLYDWVLENQAVMGFGRASEDRERVGAKSFFFLCTYSVLRKGYDLLSTSSSISWFFFNLLDSCPSLISRSVS